MSIINEALKKAEEEKRKEVSIDKAELVPRPLESPAPKFKTGQARKKKKPAIIGIAVVFSAGVLISALFVTKIVPVAVSNKKVFKSEDAPSSTAPPSLTLNGIVYDEERPYAIVNNEVLLAGDSIEGATLVKIDRDAVRFIFNDKEFEIKSK